MVRDPHNLKNNPRKRYQISFETDPPFTFRERGVRTTTKLKVSINDALASQLLRAANGELFKRWRWHVPSATLG